MDMFLPTSQINQEVKGDRNIVIAQMSGGTVVGNVETFIQQIQAQPLISSLHQLPPDIADFAGRHEETKEIISLLQQISEHATFPAISVISGMAGVGKSALAIHVAHQLRSEFSDVQLYVNLRGVEDDSLDPADVLAGWLRAFGVDETLIPASLEERLMVYRSQLVDKRALILLDNARDEAQVRPLLPGSPSCAVLITSRHRLVALEGAKSIDLDVMLEGDAQALLEKIVGVERVQTEQAAANQILNSCGLLPLAIRIAGASLRQKAHWRLEGYANKLIDEQKRLEYLHLSDLNVRSSFELSYRELKATEARLFRFLGLLPGDLMLSTAAVLFELDFDATDIVLDLQKAEKAMEKLVDSQLLEAHGEGSYRFHSLIRLFAQEQLAHGETAEVQEVVRLRVAAWYELILQYMTPTLNSNVQQSLAQCTSESPKDLLLKVLDWFERERTNVLAAATWAYQLQKWKIVISLTKSLSDFIGIRPPRWTDWERICLFALEASQALGDRILEGSIHGILGILYRNQGRWQEAEDRLHQSLRVSHELADRRAEGSNLMHLSSIYSEQRRGQEAVDCAEQALLAFQSLGDQRWEANALMELGNANRAEQQWQNAIDSYQQSLKFFQDLGDLQGQGQVLGNLGLAYFTQEDLQEAINYQKQSLSILRELGDRHGEGIALSNLGKFYQQQKQWQEARDCYQQDLTICRDLGDRHGEAVTLMNLGELQRLQEHWDEATVCYEQSIQIFYELENHEGEANVLSILGHMLTGLELWEQTISCYEKSLNLYSELDDHHGQALASSGLAHAYFLQGYSQEAITFHQQSLEASKAVSDRQGEGQSLNDIGTAYCQQGLVLEAMPYLEKSLKIAQELGDLHSEGRSLNNISNCYLQQGLWQQAASYGEQSLDFFRQLSDLKGEEEALANLSVAYSQQLSLQDAINCQQRRLKISRILGNRQGEGRVLQGLGRIYSEQQQVQESIDCYIESLFIHREVGDHQNEANILIDLGAIYAQEKNYEEAIICLEKSKAICHELGDQKGEAQGALNLGSIYGLQERNSDAIDSYRQSFDIFRALEDGHGEGLVLSSLGAIFKAQEQIQLARSVWEEALQKLDRDSTEYSKVMVWYVQLLVQHFSKSPRWFSWFSWSLLSCAFVLLIFNLLKGRWLISLGIGIITVLTEFILKLIRKKLVFKKDGEKLLLRLNERKLGWDTKIK